MAQLKNINFMTKTQFDSLESVSMDELYAVKSEVVVKTYSDEDGNWYRLYSDGWIEQGGVISTVNKSAVTLTFLKEMRDTNYTFLVTQKDGTEGDYSNGFNTKTYTTTNLVIMNRTGGTCPTNWVLYGYVA